MEGTMHENDIILKFVSQNRNHGARDVVLFSDYYSQTILRDIACLRPNVLIHHPQDYNKTISVRDLWPSPRAIRFKNGDHRNVQLIAAQKYIAYTAIILFFMMISPSAAQLTLLVLNLFQPRHRVAIRCTIWHHFFPMTLCSTQTKHNCVPHQYQYVPPCTAIALLCRAVQCTQEMR